MGFTMGITERGTRRPAAICDRCGQPAGAGGFVLWGSQVRDESEGEGEAEEDKPFTTVDGADPVTVAVACNEACRDFVHQLYEVELPYVTVEDYVAFFAITANINVLDVAGRGMARDHGPEGEAPPVSE